MLAKTLLVVTLALGVAAPAAARADSVDWSQYIDHSAPAPAAKQRPPAAHHRAVRSAKATKVKAKRRARRRRH